MATRRIAGRRAVRNTPQRRKFVWARSSTGAEAAIGTVTSSNLLSAFETEYGANLLGATVARIRGVIMVNPPATPAFGEAVVGVRIGEDDPGVTEVGPLANPHSDYMLYEPFLWSAVNTGWTTMEAPQVRVVDVKSMRKFEELGQRLEIVADSSSTSTELAWHLSIGLLLP